jgi:hypothetical protein
MNNLPFQNYLGPKVVESYLLKKRTKKNSLIKERTSEKYFHISIEENGIFSYKTNKNMKDWRKQIQLKDIISFLPKVDDEDKNICDYTLGFQIFTNEKKFILFCREEETYYKWIRVLTFLLKKTDIGTHKSTSKPRVPSVLRTEKSRLSETITPTKKFGISDKIPSSSMVGDDDDHCLSTMNGIDKVDLDKFGFLSKSLFMDANEDEGVINFSLVENLNKISVKGTNNRTSKTTSNNIQDTKSQSTAHFVNQDIKKEFKEDMVKDINFQNKAKNTNNEVEEYNYKNVLTFSKYQPVNISSVNEKQNQNSLIEENQISLKKSNFSSFKKGNEVDEFIFDVEKEAFIGWDKRINFPIGTNKQENPKSKSDKKTSDTTNNINTKTQTPFMTQKESSTLTDNNLKELLRENSLHLPQGLSGEKIQIENLHRGIDDEERCIDRKKTIQIGSFFMKDVNMINISKEEKAPVQENPSMRRTYHQIVDQMKEGLKSGNFMVERNISEGDDNRTWYLNLNIKPK